MSSFEITRKKPVKPPVDEVIIRLSIEEFKEMHRQVTLGLFPERSTHKFFSNLMQVILTDDFDDKLTGS